MPEKNGSMPKPASSGSDRLADSRSVRPCVRLSSCIRVITARQAKNIRLSPHTVCSVAIHKYSTPADTAISSTGSAPGSIRSRHSTDARQSAQAARKAHSTA